MSLRAERSNLSRCGLRLLRRYAPRNDLKEKGNKHVKYVVGIIQPDRLDEVLKRLTDEEVHLVTVSNVLGRGRQKGIAQVYRSHKEQGSLLKKVKLEIAVNEAFVEKTVKAIVGGAQSGQIGDGKIFILDLHECVRIRTGERGGEAIG